MGQNALFRVEIEIRLALHAAGMGNITTAHSILGLPLPHCPHDIAARTVCIKTICLVLDYQLDNCLVHICICNPP